MPGLNVSWTAECRSMWSVVEQFLLLLTGFACMGAACGFERSLLPRMALAVFGSYKSSTRLQFVATFGLAKAVANAVSGPLADTFGRKPVLIAGCLIGLPVMPYVIVAQEWNAIIWMNCAFGVSQGLLGSSLFFLLIDVMGPARRGVAVGIGESTIYLSTALVNILAGCLASQYGFRPIPFYVASAIAVVGLLSTIPIRDTLDQVQAEQKAQQQQQQEQQQHTQNNNHPQKYARMMSTQPSHTDEEYFPIIATHHQSHGSLDQYVYPWKSKEQKQHDDYYDDLLPFEQLPSPPTWSDEEHKTSTSIRGLAEALNKAANMAEQQQQDQHPKFSSYEYQSISNQSSNTTKEATNSSSYVSTPASRRSRSASHGSTVDGSIIDNEESSMISVLLHTQDSTSPLQTLLTLLRENPSYVSLCMTGLALNFKDGFAWGSFPVFFKQEHALSDADTDLLVALYPLCWGFGQAAAGALSDKFGRQYFLFLGTAACTAAMALFTVPAALWGTQGDARHFRVWLGADVLLGIGTALVYPALQAASADEVDPINRGLALGFYRFVRDMGYVVGAVTCGQLTDVIGYQYTFLVNAAVLALALLLLTLFYRSKSPEETALAIYVATEIEEGKSRQKEETTPVSNVPRVQRVLIQQCSDSF